MPFSCLSVGGAASGCQMNRQAFSFSVVQPIERPRRQDLFGICRQQCKRRRPSCCRFTADFFRLDLPQRHTPVQQRQQGGLGNGINLTLVGTNACTGGATISAGNLTISGGAALADNGIVTLANASGAVLSVSASETIGSLSGGGSTGGNIVIASGPTLTVNQTTDTTFSGAISGANLVKTGSGNLTLNGTNTLSGTITINAGTLIAPEQLERWV